jgi:hypothetical protein
MRTLITALALALALPAQAGPLGAADKSVNLPVTVSAVAFTTLAMNVARTTDALNVWGLDYVTFTAIHTNDSATAFVMTCDYSDEATATNWVQIPAWTWTASDTTTRAQRKWYTAVSGDLNWPVTVNVNGYRWLRCTFTSTAGAAADKLTVTAKGAVE